MKMPDPFGSFQGMMSQFQGFLKNPMQMISRRVPNLPPNMQGDPDAIIQYMMDNGIVNQEMYNMANQISGQASKNPMFQNLMGGNRWNKR